MIMTKLFRFITLPDAIAHNSEVEVLKNRLDWGEPALTIIDVRDQSAFNASHIMGAIAMPIAELVSRAQASLELSATFMSTARARSKRLKLQNNCATLVIRTLQNSSAGSPPGKRLSTPPREYQRFSVKSWLV
jgi:rhodanese-related sulfurtransferase